MTTYEIVLKLCESVDHEDTAYRIIEAAVDANLISVKESIRLEDEIGLT